MAEEMNISVSLVLKFDDGHVAVAVPRQAELYDEQDKTKPNARCIRLKGITHPTQRNPDGTRALLPWLESVQGALLHTDAPGSLALGSNSIVGLTGEDPGIWTKSIPAIPVDSLAPFTIEGLRRAGLI